jgi:hypothetical protein
MSGAAPVLARGLAGMREGDGRPFDIVPAHGA